MKVSWIWVVVGAVAAYCFFKKREELLAERKKQEELLAERKKQEGLAVLKQMLEMPGYNQSLQELMDEFRKKNE